MCLFLSGRYYIRNLADEMREVKKSGEQRKYESRHEKTNNVAVSYETTKISQSISSVRSECSLTALRNHGT